MDSFHRSLIEIGLSSADRYGFALAGGYAVQAHGFVERPSEDVDLFGAIEMDCPAAAAQVAEAYRDAGLDVETLQSTDRYVRLWVVQPGTDLGCKVEIVADVRFEPPVRMAMGPVLHPDDVAAGKVEALFDRALARDFMLAFVHRRVDQEFSVYGVDAEAVARIRRRFADWEQELRLAP